MKRRMLCVATLLGFVACLGMRAAGEEPRQEQSQVPGVVIAHSPAKSQAYIGSPSIAVLPGGEYVASHDMFGPGTTFDRTVVFGSRDRGKSWKELAEVEGQFWSTLFVHRNALYLLGTDKRYGAIVIRRSTDGGRTWTTPSDRKHGLLFADAKYHCAPVPVVMHGGRIWRAFEDAEGGGGWGRHFRALVISASEDADLLDADSWTTSNRLAMDPKWVKGPRPGWLEGNVVVAPDGRLVNILRVNDARGDTAAILPISADGKTLSFDPTNGLIDFPGGRNKFTIRFDPKAQCYWSLANKELDPPAFRNVLALTRSTDLRQWDVQSIVLRHEDSRHHAWQYVDWLFDGDDLIAVSRTGWDGSHNAHDANYMTFHRVSNFRTRTMADSPPYLCSKPDFDQVPGVVVTHSPAASKIYVGSPGIAVLPNGDYVIKCDLFGPGAPKTDAPITRLFRSSDRGKTWTQLTDVPQLGWASIFLHRGELFLLGTGGTDRQVVIRKSTDGGRTWTSPVDDKSGLLLPEHGYHCAPVPVVVHNGRIWRAMEDTAGPRGWGNCFRAFMMSAPADADLLVAANWTTSTRLDRNPDWLNGEFGGWLEGNAVATPEGQIVNILRVHYLPTGGKAAMIRVSDDGKMATFDPDTGFVDFPGGCKKFTIRHDPKTGRYWSLTNFIPEWDQGGNPERTRNTLALVSSPDLHNWTVHSIVVYHPDLSRHGFQYVDWLFDGDDLVAASRTACDDGKGGAHNQHDANFITFHRIRDFRKLTMADFEPPKALTAVRWETPDFEVTGYGFAPAAVFADGVKAFGNRTYVWEKIPERYQNWKYTQTNGGVTARLTIRAKRDCVVHAATSAGRSAYEMLKWTPVENGTFHYTDGGHTEMVIYERALKAGETAQVPQGTWTGTVMLAPQGRP